MTEPGGDSGGGADTPTARAARPRRATRGSPPPREVELKYLVRDLEALRAWLAKGWGGALPEATLGEGQVVEVEDRYLDTAYGALEQAGFGARLRREDGGPMNVTVKTISRDRADSGAADEAAVAGPAALSQRVEVEGPADERLDPGLWRPSAARELMATRSRRSSAAHALHPQPAA